MDKINHRELAVSRLATQYSESANLIGYVKALLSEADNLEQVFCDILELRTLDNATGFTLDILGVLVGQPRVLVDSTELEFFGFEDAPNSLGFGDLNDPSVGGRYLSLGESTTGNRELDDEEYRLFIRSRISKNMSSGTVDDVIRLSAFVTGAPEVDLSEGNAAIILGFGTKLDTNTKTFLKNNDLIPKPAGVRIEFLFDYNAENVFAYGDLDNSDTPGLGYGDLADSSVGGEYASLL